MFSSLDSESDTEPHRVPIRNKGGSENAYEEPQDVKSPFAGGQALTHCAKALKAENINPFVTRHVANVRDAQLPEVLNICLLWTHLP